MDPQRRWSVVEEGWPEGGAEPWVHRLTLTIYSTITLLAVLVAATAKDYVDNAFELDVLVVGSAIGLIIAHGWAGTIAVVVIHRQPLSAGLVGRELWQAIWALIPAGLVVITSILVFAITDDFDTLAVTVEMALVALLVAAAIVAARRMDLGWGRSLAWGLASYLVGMCAVMIKILLG